MYKLLKIERERQISLPEVYRNFFKICSSYIPPKLVGTNLINDCPDLYQWAVELLEEDGVENFLEKDDFVFMMHQGYMFWYFKADGNPDPTVFGYFEEKLKLDNKGFLSVFVNEFID